MTPTDLERAVRPLIDAALSLRVLQAQAEVAADALNRFAAIAYSGGDYSREALLAAAPRQSARVAQALALVDAGTHTALQAARAVGVAPSTIYRAIAVRRASTGS